MAKLTLLEMTQNILSAMDSDEVNSIHDTVESQQVARTIKETYYDLFSSMYVPERKGLINLEGLGDLSKENFLRIPTGVTGIEWVKYKNSDDKFTDLIYYPPDVFLDRVLQNTSSSDNVHLVQLSNNISFYVKNNHAPTFYTIFDDEYLITDSWDSAVDSTLQASKTIAYGYTEEVWMESDTFIPDIDSDLFPLLLSEAKAVCFINIKQVANQKEEARARRHRVHLQYRKWKNNKSRIGEFEGPNYARNR